MPHLHAPTRARCVLSRADEVKVLAAFGTPADRALFLMALDTLVRMGDCLDLRRSDDHGRTLYIRDPKAGDGYRVPVSQRLRAALDAVPKDGPYYFTFRRRHATAGARRNGVKKMLASACAKAGVAYGRKDGGLTFHWATRRTGATRMLEAGIDFPTVQRVGHWGDPTMLLGIYAESDDARARAAVERIGPDMGLTPPPKPAKRPTKQG
jgi:integrase